MTPAERPSEAANVLRLAYLTAQGKKTTAAPNAVAAPAPNVNAKAMRTLFSSSFVVLSVDMIIIIKIRLLRKGATVEDSLLRQTLGEPRIGKWRYL